MPGGMMGSGNQGGGQQGSSMGNMMGMMNGMNMMGGMMQCGMEQHHDASPKSGEAPE
jgi:hypothetical protein